MEIVTWILVIFGLTLVLLVLVNLVVFQFMNPKKKETSKQPIKPSFKAINDKYETIEDVQVALRKAGLECSNLILGIDYTASNVHTGRLTFDGHCLHDISAEVQPNPYQQVIGIMGRTLEPFDEDKFIPAFGFGDSRTTERSVFPFFTEDECNKKEEYSRFRSVLNRYQEITPTVKMAGPTNFAPIIREAISIVQKTGSYHILVIIADGQVTCERDTKAAIVEASHFPLSILLVGVGDGPWNMMKKFDNELPKRMFDNFQFVNFHEVKQKSAPLYFEAAFALESLMEIPTQFKLIKKLGLINPKKQK